MIILLQLILLLSGIVLILALSDNLHRRRIIQEKMTDFHLIPNCLLTRYPLVFIPGKRSLFYFMEYFNELPRYLAEHGFEVYKAHLPWQDSLARKEQCLKILKANKTPVHLVLTEETWMELSSALKDSPKISSITLLSQKATPSMPTELPSVSHPWPLSKIIWKLHAKLTKDSTPAETLGLDKNYNAQIQKKLLNRANELGEIDFTKGLST